jgi:hypothetical protein
MSYLLDRATQFDELFENLTMKMLRVCRFQRSPQFKDAGGVQSRGDQTTVRIDINPRLLWSTLQAPGDLSRLHLRGHARPYMHT